MTQTGRISDGASPGKVQLAGGGTLVLANAANSYSGGTVVTEASTLSISADGDLGAVAGGLTLGDADTAGILVVTNTLSSARNITLGAGDAGIVTSSGVTATLGGVISGDGGLFLLGPGTVSLTNADSYTGGTTIAAGTLQLGSGGSLASSGLLTIGGGTFDLNGNDQTVAGLTIIPGSAGAIMLGDATLTVNQADTTQFNGVISGEGGLTKTGAGLLSLTGASTYTGATTVDAGTLRLDPRGSLATTTALIVDGGIFDLENGGQTVDRSPAPAAPSLWAMAA